MTKYTKSDSFYYYIIIFDFVLTALVGGGGGMSVFLTNFLLMEIFKTLMLSRLS